MKVVVRASEFFNRQKQPTNKFPTPNRRQLHYIPFY